MPDIIFVTQVVDPDDQDLGFVVDLVRALDAAGGRVVVIANEVRAVPGDLRAEVVSLGKERGRRRWQRMLAFERALAHHSRALDRPSVFAHMCPDYVLASAPLTRVRGLPLMLWYVHPGYRPELRLAERLVDVVLTAVPGSYPGRGPKVRAIGHAIDTTMFHCIPPGPHSGPLRLLSAGRMSPAKGYPTILRAVARARDEGVDVNLRVVGPASTSWEREHRVELEALVTDLRIGDVVGLEAGVPYRAMPAVLQDADAFVSGSGSLDKVVLQAMACGRPVVTSNPDFGPLLQGAGLDPLFPAGDEAVLSSRLRALAAATPEQRATAGAALRAAVEENHALSGWVRAVVACAAEERRPRSRLVPKPFWSGH